MKLLEVLQNAERRNPVLFDSNLLEVSAIFKRTKDGMRHIAFRKARFSNQRQFGQLVKIAETS